jgi:NTP pyrophosphatase (non-canonical NTP hydrolase)
LIDSINALAKIIHETARSKGFYEPTDSMPDGARNPVWIACRLMLVVSELGEALEAVRDGNFNAEPKSGGLMEELADACIRLFDLAYSIDGDLAQAIWVKMAFNAARPKGHGRKAL